MNVKWIGISIMCIGVIGTIVGPWNINCFDHVASAIFLEIYGFVVLLLGCFIGD